MFKLACSWKLFWHILLPFTLLFSSCGSFNCTNGICTEKIKELTDLGKIKSNYTYTANELILNRGLLSDTSLLVELKKNGFKKVKSCSCAQQIELWKSDSSKNPLIDLIGELKDPPPRPDPIGDTIPLLPNLVVEDNLKIIRKKNHAEVNPITLDISPKKRVKVAIIDSGIDSSVISPNNKLFAAGWEILQYDPTCIQYPGSNGSQRFIQKIRDDMGHGTHINGIIAGLAQEPSLNPLVRNKDFFEPINIKFMPNKTEKGTVFDALCGMYFALEQGASVINISWGYLAANTKGNNSASYFFNDFIRAAQKRDVIIVAGSGNDGKLLNDSLGFWPASFAKYFDNVISVGAINPRIGFPWLKSNRALDGQVTLYAPGVKVLSCYPKYLRGNKSQVDDQAVMSGTSMSTAFVTRTAAILRALHPEWTAREVRDHLILTAKTGVLDHNNAVHSTFK